jgi:hypothetical protein
MSHPRFIACPTASRLRLNRLHRDDLTNSGCSRSPGFRRGAHDVDGKPSHVARWNDQTAEQPGAAHGRDQRHDAQNPIVPIARTMQALMA